MRTKYLTWLVILTSLFFFSCRNSTKEKELADKENELLKKENELLKKELKNSDTTFPLTNNTPTLITTPPTLVTTSKTKTFVVDKSAIKTAFLTYLPNISGGRKLSTCIVILGDLNGDKLIDGIVDYGLEPTYEDNGGGNSISEIPGLIAFTNTGTNLIVADHSENFGGNFGSRNELKKISNGIVFLEVLDYAEDDARCCPTLKTTTKLILRNNKLTELKKDANLSNEEDLKNLMEFIDNFEKTHQ